MPPGTLPVVRIASPEVTATCSDAAYPGPDRPGATNAHPCTPEVPVTSPEGAFTDHAPLSIIDGLTDIDRRRIVSLPDDVIQGLAEADVPTIARTLIVSVAQADQLRQEIDRRQAAVLALAQAQVNAALSLQCRWYNPALTSVCPPDAACPGATGGPYPENGVGWTVPCGRFSSTTSQAEATAQAQDLLCRETVCVWKNVERTVYCRGRGVEVDPDAAPVPPGTASGGWDPLYTTGGDQAGGTQTGSLTVPAGTYTSVVSQQDADRQALDFALSTLVCAYSNDAVRAVCEAAVTPGPCAGDDPPHQPTNRSLPVPARTFILTFPPEDLDSPTDNTYGLQVQATADAQAAAQKDCPWCNDPVTGACGTQYLWYSPVQDKFEAEAAIGLDPFPPAACAVRVPVESSTGGTGVTIPACYCVSYTSWCDAQACGRTEKKTPTFAGRGLRSGEYEEEY